MARTNSPSQYTERMNGCRKATTAEPPADTSRARNISGKLVIIGILAVALAARRRKLVVSLHRHAPRRRILGTGSRAR